jgi:hypothetical protein
VRFCFCEENGPGNSGAVRFAVIDDGRLAMGSGGSSSNAKAGGDDWSRSSAACDGRFSLRPVAPTFFGFPFVTFFLGLVAGSAALGEFDAFFLSIAIESPVAWLIVRLTGWVCRGPSAAAIGAALATGVTHPRLWDLALALGDAGVLSLGVMVALELAVTALEAVMLGWMLGLGERESFLLSLATNGTSFGAGLILSALGFWG